MVSGNILGWGYALAAALILGGMIAFGVGLSNRQSESRIVNGVHVTGMVRYAEVHTTDSFHQTQQNTYYSLLVDYPVGTGGQRHDFPCTYLAYIEHPAGSSVEVDYDPSDPNHAQLGGNLNESSSSYVLFAAIGVFVLGVLAAILTRLKLRDQAHEDEDAGDENDDEPPTGSKWSSDPLAGGGSDDIPVR